MPCICRGLLIDMCMSRHADVLGHEVTHTYMHMNVCLYVHVNVHVHIYIYMEILRIYMFINMKDVPIPCVSPERREMPPLKDVRILADLSERRRIVKELKNIYFSFFIS